jgi:hypothetical protein
MRIFVALLVALSAAVASAQLYPQKPGLLESTALRLGEASFRFELKTSSKQNAAITEAFSSHGVKQRALSGQMAKAKPETFGALQAKIEALESTTAKRILATLTSSQRQRLWEVGIQNEGPFALRNAEVAKRIGVTPDQKAKIEVIAKRTAGQSDELNAKMGSEIEVAKSEKQRTQIVKSYEPKLKAIESKGEAEVMALLSKAQVQKWQKAKGKPYKL